MKVARGAGFTHAIHAARREREKKAADARKKEGARAGGTALKLAEGGPTGSSSGFKSLWKPDTTAVSKCLAYIRFPPEICLDTTRPYIVSMEGRPRLLAFHNWAGRILRTKTFDSLVMVAILSATLLVGIQTYNPVGAIWDILEYIILGIFVCEVIFKLAAEGLLIYFTTVWNLFDFAIVICSLPIFPIEDDSIVVLRMLRLLRVAKLVKAIPQLRMIIMGLQSGLSSIFYILVLMLMVLYVFSILGIMLFRENDPFHFRDLGSAMITLFRVATLEDWTDIMYINIYGCGVTNYGYEAAPRGNHGHLSTAGSWRGGAPIGGEGREKHPPCVMGSDGSSHFIAVFYFVFFVVCTGLVLVSLFIGVVTTSMCEATAEIAAEAKIERERKNERRAVERKQQLQRADSIAAGEMKDSVQEHMTNWMSYFRDWFDAPVREMRDPTPEDSGYNRLSLRAKAWVESAMFNNFILIIIFFAALLAGLETFEGAPQELIQWAEYVILAVFSVECIMKLVAEQAATWYYYFRRRMNLFDLAIVVICIVTTFGTGEPERGQVGDDLMSDNQGAWATLRLLRLLRLLKLLDAVPQLQIIIVGLQGGLASISFIFMLLFLIFYVFGIFGLVMFQKNDPFHFQTLHIALLSLFRAATFEDWTDIMYINVYGCDYWGYGPFDENGTDIGGLPDPSDPTEQVYCTDPKAGGALALMYFVLFTVIASFIVLSLFVGVVTTSMFDAQREQAISKNSKETLANLRAAYKSQLSDDYLGHLKSLFCKLDSDGSGYVTHEEMAGLVIESTLTWSKARRDLMINNMDINGDGCVDFGEFVTVVMKSRAVDDNNRLHATGAPRHTPRNSFLTDAKEMIGILLPPVQPGTPENGIASPRASNSCPQRNTDDSTDTQQGAVGGGDTNTSTSTGAITDSRDTPVRGFESERVALGSTIPRFDMQTVHVLPPGLPGRTS